MPKATVTIESNLMDGAEMAERLSNEIPKGVDDAADKIANGWIREAQRVMMKNGNVVTGTGLRSFSTQDMGLGKQAVFGANYLNLLDTGTVAHIPDTSNPRFIAAARSYGMDRYSLAATIARKGTQPHPWLNETNSKMRRKAPRKVSIELDQAMKRSVK